ncbi:arginine repressor [Butyricicoccus porcorum]|uniref:Arginine repressor n=1 Tax=Butyricicoccus porcorum TaxID=1945634 RepID=A0A252F236_9FIRM|nr:arginine repressor [Butyricicoccus porcorum]MCI6926640.1 arginine repressor [Butyricicoccus porcorum]MDD6986838.1 arginine repressor [Butyricicoccus porcorum]MDY4483182.1 arginine repressor [Butyricicoccus porcorum]OUM19761.1 arginine repressor [Butyricicoccus porcorum]
MKFQRQAKILELIEHNEIETQEELSMRLRDLGYDTTQATVSRDIKDLRLIKILSPSGKYRYATSTQEAENSFVSRLQNIFRECVTGVDAAQNIVVIKTLPALASAAAMAIDAMRVPKVVGTISGDDTVFIVMRDNESALDFCEDTKNMLK